MGNATANRPESLKAYVDMITRRLSLNVYAAKNAKKRRSQVGLMLDGLSECLPGMGSRGDIGDGIALRDALNRFIHGLPEKTQKAFVRRYWY